MRIMLKLGILSIAATAMLGALVSTASARNLSISNRNLRATFSALDFHDQFNIARLRCKVTLEGSFHASTFPKVERSLIGYITRAIIGHPCTGSEAWAHNGSEVEPGGTTPQTLPWPLSYESFSGSLPNITSIQPLVSGFRFTVEVPGFCSGVIGEAGANIRAIATREAGGALSGIRPSRTSSLTGTSGSCIGIRAFFEESTGSVMVLGTVTRITVTLI